jgi:hypothetical protein
LQESQEELRFEIRVAKMPRAVNGEPEHIMSNMALDALSALMREKSQCWINIRRRNVLCVTDVRIISKRNRIELITSKLAERDREDSPGNCCFSI